MEDAIVLLAMLAVAIVFYFLSVGLLRWFGRTLPMPLRGHSRVLGHKRTSAAARKTQS